MQCPTSDYDVFVAEQYIKMFEGFYSDGKETEKKRIPPSANACLNTNGLFPKGYPEAWVCAHVTKPCFKLLGSRQHQNAEQPFLQQLHERTLRRIRLAADLAWSRRCVDVAVLESRDYLPGSCFRKVHGIDGTFHLVSSPVSGIYRT